VTVPEGKTPWLDDEAAPAELRALVATGRADGPSAEQLERLAGRIAPLVGITAAALVVPTPAPALAVAPASPAPLTAAGALGKVAAAKLAWSGALKLAATACVLGAGYFVLAPAAREAKPASHSVATAPAVVQAPAPIAAPTPMLEAPVEAPVAAPVAAPTVREKPASKPLVRPSELELIHRAERAEPAAALAALRTHERLYPDGMLAQEREVLVIRSLLALSRRPDAEARAASMASRYPGSAHLRRVRVLLDEPAGK
jgi:hypothetical protein